jgi:hypothetical protein
MLDGVGDPQPQNRAVVIALLAPLAGEEKRGHTRIGAALRNDVGRDFFYLFLASRHKSATSSGLAGSISRAMITGENGDS